MLGGGVGFVLGATTPLWFLEGDAVGFETFATGYGRGRLPSFNMQSQAMLLQLGSFNYDKASFGSFKTFVPDRYAFGYHLTSYVKEKYGINTWDSVMNRVATFPLRPFPFSSSLKKYTGKGTSKMYKGKNGQEFATNATATGTNTGTLPSANISIGKIQGYGEWSNQQGAFVSIGDGLTHAESAKLYGIVQIYQITLGRV